MTNSYSPTILDLLRTIKGIMIQFEEPYSYEEMGALLREANRVKALLPELIYNQYDGGKGTRLEQIAVDMDYSYGTVYTFYKKHVAELREQEIERRRSSHDRGQYS